MLGMQKIVSATVQMPRIGYANEVVANAGRLITIAPGKRVRYADGESLLPGYIQYKTLISKIREEKLEDLVTGKVTPGIEPEPLMALEDFIVKLSLVKPVAFDEQAARAQFLADQVDIDDFLPEFIQNGAQPTVIGTNNEFLAQLTKEARKSYRSFVKELKDSILNKEMEYKRDMDSAGKRYEDLAMNHVKRMDSYKSNLKEYNALSEKFYKALRCLFSDIICDNVQEDVRDNGFEIALENLNKRIFRKSKEEAHFLNNLIDWFIYTKEMNLVVILQIIDIIYELLAECGQNRTEMQKLADLGRMINNGNDGHLKKAYNFCEMADMELDETISKITNEYRKGLLLAEGTKKAANNKYDRPRGAGAVEMANQASKQLTKNKCNQCGRNHYGVCFGKNWKHGDPVPIKSTENYARQMVVPEEERKNADYINLKKDVEKLIKESKRTTKTVVADKAKNAKKVKRVEWAKKATAPIIDKYQYYYDNYGGSSDGESANMVRRSISKPYYDDDDESNSGRKTPSPDKDDDDSNDYNNKVKIVDNHDTQIVDLTLSSGEKSDVSTSSSTESIPDLNVLVRERDMEIKYPIKHNVTTPDIKGRKFNVHQEITLKQTLRTNHHLDFEEEKLNLPNGRKVRKEQLCGLQYLTYDSHPSFKIVEDSLCVIINDHIAWSKDLTTWNELTEALYNNNIIWENDRLIWNPDSKPITRDVSISASTDVLISPILKRSPVRNIKKEPLTRDSDTEVNNEQMTTGIKMVGFDNDKLWIDHSKNEGEINPAKRKRKTRKRNVRAYQMVEASNKVSSTKFKICSDAGASSVMTPDINLVREFVPLVETVKLPNGSTLMSTGRGKFGPVNDAMVVPELTDTLVSVSSFDCIGYFTVYGDRKVKIYDGDPTLNSSKVMYVGYLARNKLYYFPDSERFDKELVNQTQNIRLRSGNVIRTNLRKHNKSSRNMGNNNNQPYIGNVNRYSDDQIDEMRVNRNIDKYNTPSPNTSGNRHTNRYSTTNNNHRHTNHHTGNNVYGDDHQMHNNDNNTIINNNINNNENITSYHDNDDPDNNTGDNVNDNDIIDDNVVRIQSRQRNCDRNLVVRNISQPTEDMNGNDNDNDQIPLTNDKINVELEKLHQITGIAKSRLIKLIQKKAVENVPFKINDSINNISMENCDTWHLANSKRAKRTMESETDKQPLYTVGLDILAPFQILSRHRNRYCFMFVDYGSRMLWPYFGPDKIAIREAILSFKRDVVDKSHFYWRELQCDSENVLNLGHTQLLLDKLNIVVRNSSPYAKFQNGMIEKSIDMVQNVARYWMIKTGCPQMYYEDAIRNSCEILCKFRLIPDKDKTPYEHFYGVKPDFKTYVPFYAKGMAHVYEEERRGPKYMPRAKIVRNLGTAINHKSAFLVVEEGTRNEMIRRDIHWMKDSSGKFITDSNNQLNNPEIAMKVVDKSWPKSIAEVLTSPDKDKWLIALKKELRACLDRGTFAITEPDNKSKSKVMTSKMIFEVKSDGRYKCRMVAQGFSQIKGVNYDETYSPTTHFKSVCTLLHDAAIKNLDIVTLDIGNAYLEARLDYKIKMKPPKGLFPYLELPEHEFELIQSLYGLKQAGRQWSRLFFTILKEYNFEQSIYDPCVFVKGENEVEIKIATYVDDVLVISINKEVRQKFISYLKSKLQEVKIYEDDITYLGVKLIRDLENRKIHLKQERYVDMILNKYLVDSDQISKYPLKESELGEEEGSPPIHELIGTLRFLVDRTRPDLLYPVSVISRYVKQPNERVMQECNRILKYILMTKNYHLVLGGTNVLELFGMSDAAFIQHGDCKSTLGYSIFLGHSAPVYNRCLRSSTVSLSSTQAEVEALVEVIKEIIWFQGFMESIGMEVTKPTKIFTDNMPAVLLAADGNHLKRSRHFIVRTAFIKEQVEKGIIKIEHISGLDNPTDLLTKALSGRLLDIHGKTLLGMK